MSGLRSIRLGFACLAASGLALSTGLGVAHASHNVDANCTWAAGDQGCVFLSPHPGTQVGVWVAWAGGTTAPLVGGTAPIFCWANAGSGGLCIYAVIPAADGIVTVTADPASAGVATEQDNL
jgi:hypothetical protein